VLGLLMETAARIFTAARGYIPAPATEAD